MLGLQLPFPHDPVAVSPQSSMSAEEPRIARDGATNSDLDWNWVEATLASAPQPGGPGPDAPPVGQDAPPVLPLAIRQPTRTVGALQPGENPWEGCFFLSETLRQNQETLRRECPQLRFATSLREAMDKAYSLGDYLPLPIQAFVNYDIVHKPRDTSLKVRWKSPEGTSGIEYFLLKMTANNNTVLER